MNLGWSRGECVFPARDDFELGGDGVLLGRGHAPEKRRAPVEAAANAWPRMAMAIED